jgi:aspartyl-tRNA(Asn)/glutamyl-tRNA(Gln) amidotransferase subunit A
MKCEQVCYLSAIDLAAAIRAKELSPVEVVELTLQRIEQVDPALNAICTIEADHARSAARVAELAVMRGEPLGPLHGVPFTVKDNLYVKKSRTTFGSLLMQHNVTTEDAPAVERIRRAGGILIGRTNTPEYGWKGVTDNRVFGITRNPWNTKLTPGGSSGGASAAVAAGMGPLGLGTDGGGSLRIPASFCGLVGFKASFGRVPNNPPGAGPTLRHIGAVTRTAGDAALALSVMSGPDERDLLSLPAADDDYLAAAAQGVAGLKLAYSPDLGYAPVDPVVARICRQAALRFAEAGATVEEVELKWPDPYDCWSVFFFGASATALAGKLASQGDLLDPGHRRVVEAGQRLTAIDYGNAIIQRTNFWQQAHVIFDQYDLLLTPTLAVKPFAVGQDDADPVPGETPRPLHWTRFTYPFNVTGQPAASIPAGWTADGLPIGLQIVGRRFADATVLRAAAAWERVQPWADRRPPVG